MFFLKNVYQVFPPGKIRHIVHIFLTFLSDVDVHYIEAAKEPTHL